MPRTLSRVTNSRRRQSTRQAEDHDVGLNCIKIYGHIFHVRQRLSQQARIGVILVEPGRHLLQCNQSRSRQDARLPHAAAQRFPVEPRLINQLLEPVSIDPTGAQRPFDRQNITVSNPRVRLYIHAEHGGRIEDARSVKVHGQLALLGPGPNLFQHRQWRDAATGKVGGVLNFNQAGGGAKGSTRIDRGLDMLPGQDATLSGNGAHKAA